MVFTLRRPEIHPQNYEQTGYRGTYSIEDGQQSKTGTIFFARHNVTGQCFVLKLLQKYKDIRYNLESLSERQRCQFEAIKWNKWFTPTVYIGLVPVVVNWEADTLTVHGELIEPEVSNLDTNKEYALLMRSLPRERQLNLLISELSPAQMPADVPFLKNLVKRISEIHSECSLDGEVCTYWGSFQQIQAKLESNFAFVESVAGGSKGLCYLDSDIQRKFQIVKGALSTMIKQNYLQECFEQRRKKARIKRCHGDLKTQNIFISSSQPEAVSDLAEYIWIIDAIDFNSSFCYIDILSDIAMLAIDIQARCHSQAIAEWIIDYYLELTGQQDSTARTVLSYYMLEKAYIGASVSVIDDDDLATGREFLKVAQQYIWKNGPDAIRSVE